MGKRQLVDVSLTFLVETDRALLCSEGGEEFWLPKSQIEYEPQDVLVRGMTIQVTLPIWLAQEKKLAGF